MKLLSDRSVSVQARKLPAIKVGDEKWPPAMVEAKLMQGVKGVKEACVVPGIAISFSHPLPCPILSAPFSVFVSMVINTCLAGEDGSVLVIVTKDLKYVAVVSLL